MITLKIQNFDDLRDIIDEAAKESIEEVGKVNVEAWRGLKVQSPVKEGTFRANWNAAVNKDDDSYDESKKDKTGSEGLPDLTFDLGDNINFTNALPYAELLDVGASSQAQQGVTRPVAAKIESYIRNRFK